MAANARMREPQSDGTRKRGGRSFRGLPPVEACAPAARRTATARRRMFMMIYAGCLDLEAEFSKPSFELFRALRESGAAKASVVTS